MTALDPTAADRILTPPSTAFATVPFGDVNLIPDVGTHAVEAWNGYPAIFCQAAGSNYLTSDDPFTLPSEWAIFVAIADCGAIDNFNPAYHESVDLDIGVSVNQVDYVADSVGYMPGAPFALTTPIGTDLVVLCLTNNATEGRFLTSDDGTIVVDAAAQSGSSSALFDVFTDGYGGDAKIVGIWLFEGVAVDETDAIDTMAAIVALFPVPTTAAVGYVEIYGTAVGVAADTVDDEPDPPTLTPGGTQDPPATPPFVVPDNVPDAVIRRISQAFDAPTLNASDFPDDWQPAQAEGEEYARLQIVVEGQDITWINGAPTPMPQWSRTEPFGSYSATIELPQLSIFQEAPAWAKSGANVEIRLVKIAEDQPDVKVFTGAVVKTGRREDRRAFTLTCHGVMFLSDLQLRTPGFKTAPRDIGAVVADTLNTAISRRYATVAAVATGSKTSVLGGWEPRLSGYIQTLLATAVTGGRQWTVKCADRSPVIERKDTTTVHWEIRAGQPGIEVDLEDDSAESPDAIFGEGTRSDGGHWSNTKYPNWNPDDTPPYPYTDPDTVIVVGTRDSDTDTGDGVSVWQEKVGRKVTRYFSTGDRTALRNIQRRGGILIDGRLGPQSWATTFNTGANTGTLDGSFQAPLAVATEVEPRLYGPDGDDLGMNPDYDAGVIRVDRKINFGQGVDIEDARTNANELLARDAGPGWQGTIDFTLDPPGGSKYEILEGQNIRVLGWAGQDILLHIASVDVNAAEITAPVRLTVDQKARDYPTLDAIRQRQRDAVDPARIAYQRLTSGRIQSDAVVYDAESPGGKLPRHPVFTDLWDVRKIPLGAYGTIAKTQITTSSPASAFCVAIFGKSITAAQLLSIVGNPLTTTDTESPWDKYGDDLDAFAFINAWGWAGQPAGFGRRSKTNPAGETGAPVTGKLLDETPLTYATQSVPWVWVATIAADSCYVEGRLYGGVN